MARAPASFEELRAKARRRLPGGLFDYIDRGVGDETALNNLRARLNAVTVRPRVLRSDAARSVACELFGVTCRAPLAIAPTAMAGLIRHDGEIVLARAAARLGLPVCLSTQSITSLADLRAAVPEADIWMQLYLWQNLDLSRAFLDEVRRADVRVLVVTVDTPYGARKPWNDRSGFGMPFRLTPRNMLDLASRPGWIARTVLPGLLRGGLPAFGNYPAAQRPGLLGPPPDPDVMMRRDLSWDDVAWIRDQWRGPLVLKGILHPDDALHAARLGAEGLIVSSHGARNFDAAPAPIDVLPEIREAAGARMTVLADSGVRTGLDVLKYRLQGARAVCLGRLPLWALAAGGEKGVRAALECVIGDYIEALDFSGAEP